MHSEFQVRVVYRFDEQLDDYVWEFILDDGKSLGTIQQPRLDLAFQIGARYAQEKLNV